MKRDLQIPEEVDDRLREWAFFFRDRRRLETCASIEKRFQPHSEDFGPGGWGDNEAPPPDRSTRDFRLPRALETHDAVQALETRYKWCLTYAFCYPSLQRHVVLRWIKRRTKRHLTWAQYLESVDFARLRVFSALKSI